MKTIFLGIFLLASSLSAALPPLYQSIKEIQSLLSAPELSKKLQSGEAIMEITREADGYLITTNKHTLQAKVNYQPQNMPGPSQFEFTFGPVKKR